jgi:hypothetical protein
LLDQHLHLNAAIQRRALQLSSVLFGSSETYLHFGHLEKKRSGTHFRLDGMSINR